MKFITIPSLALASLIGFTSCGKKDDSTETDQKVMRISAIPDQDTTAQAERFAPFVAYLEKALEKHNVKVEFVPSDSYGASVEKFALGDIHLAWFGGVTGVQAQQKVEGARSIIAGKKDLAFKSYFVAHKSTGLQYSTEFPAAIADMNFTFGSSSSTSGCVMPSFYIKENSGKFPKNFFSKPTGYTGAHDKTALAVQNGDYQVGAMSFGKYESMVKAGTIDPAVCVKIWETPTYADYNVTVHPELEEIFGKGFIDELQQVLATCKDEAALKAIDRKELVKINNSTLSGIADVLEATKK